MMDFVGRHIKEMHHATSGIKVQTQCVDRQGHNQNGAFICSGEIIDQSLALV
jgi:hypothetical protein